MGELSVVRDLDRCRELWESVYPREVLTDLWEVRAIFHRRFRRPPHFVANADGNEILGLLPLSWIEEHGSYGFFPGETWKGKTWLEQNRVHSDGNGGFDALMSRVPGPFHIRYLAASPGLPAERAAVDETGYLFYPESFDYALDNWWGQFSGKNAKRLRREVDSVAGLGASFRRDDLGDYPALVRMNQARFGTNSYFSDPRFRESFSALTAFLAEKGWLRITTLLLKGEVAAIDMGCLYNGRYTLLAGGTNPDFPGAAKVINLHHMERACDERMREVDFLCGDFKWKPLFHLSPRPLYVVTGTAPQHG